ncbi:LPXTG cell wall anchor domain-containing protein [Streptococcus suis]|nr:LPXTG cell wall anchor domain-containing protein [Streptococcus suis]
MKTEDKQNKTAPNTVATLPKTGEQTSIWKTLTGLMMFVVALAVAGFRPKKQR